MTKGKTSFKGKHTVKVDQSLINLVQFSSVQFSCLFMTDSLRPHESQQARPPCPSLTPGVYSNSCPSSQWSHPTISSSVVPFSSCPQSSPASGSFPMSQLFASGIGISALASVLPMNIQEWSPLGSPLGWISLQSKGLSRVFSNTTVQKHHSFSGSAYFIVQLSHPYMTTEKTIALTKQTFVGKIISLLFNMLFRFVRLGRNLVENQHWGKNLNDLDVRNETLF